ncbi:DUF1501 domain-containing protein [Schlesneria sp. T3-172]|uniref:DUF1501 domain-containing protein n=1 Tax=Schlesneria sphaerica TaxID=3373610 RepID=UPI0037C5A45F
MLHLFTNPTHNSGQVTRRQLLKMSALSTGIAGGLGHLPQAKAETHSSRGRAKGCIYLFLCGGPSQPDLWDLKPLAPSGVRSEFDSIATSVPGLHFGELIPQVARHADKLAVIRSMTHTDNDHVGAIVHSLLGQLPAGPGQFYIDRKDHPGLGAIVQSQRPQNSPLPPWIVLPRYFTTGSPAYKGQSAGFLGSPYDPLVFNKETKASLSDSPLTLGDLELSAGITRERLMARHDLSRSLGQKLTAGNTARAGEMFEQAFGMLVTPAVRRALQLDDESTQTRERYGRNEYGQSLLMARRLIEAGVQFVNVFWTFFDSKGCQFNLWDNHGVANDVCGIDGQLTGRQQLTHQYCTPSFDRSFSALIEDLSDRGLLDETLVAVAGEFGRTPKINATAGRDHWAHCYTQLLAGGGVRGGSIWGESDAQGAYVARDPVSPDDFAATILHAFGIDAESLIKDNLGRPLPVTTGRPVTALF